MKSYIKKSILFISIILFANTLFAQDLDVNKTARGLAQLAFEKSYNIKAGIGYHSFFAEESSASFSEKINFKANTLTYFIAFTTSDRWMQSNTYLNYEIQLGKSKYSAIPNLTDTVNVFNCTSYSYYYLAVPFQLSFRNYIGKNMYWAINPGIYFDLSIGKQSNELENGSLSRKITYSVNYEHQDMKMLDFGAKTDIELGYRAAYFGVSYKIGLKNLLS